MILFQIDSFGYGTDRTRQHLGVTGNGVRENEFAAALQD
jgi:hypothetical protein